MSKVFIPDEGQPIIIATNSPGKAKGSARTNPSSAMDGAGIGRELFANHLLRSRVILKDHIGWRAYRRGIGCFAAFPMWRARRLQAKPIAD